MAEYDFSSLDALAQSPAASGEAPATPSYDFSSLGPDPQQEAKNAALFEASFGSASEEGKKKRLSASIQRMSGEYVAPAVMDVAEATRRARHLEADHATRASPRTSVFLSSEENARVAIDDAKTMAQIEAGIDQVWGPLRDGFADANKHTGFPPIKTLTKAVLGSIGGAMTLVPGVAPVMSGLGKFPYAFSEGAYGLLQGAAEFVQPVTSPLANLLHTQDPAAQVAAYAGGQAATADYIQKSAFPDYSKSFVNRNLEGAGSSLGLLAATFPLGLATASVTAETAALRGLSPLMQEIWRTLGFVAPQSVLTGGQGYAESRREGAPVWAAQTRGIADTVFEAAGELAPTAKFLRVTEGATKDIAKGFLKSLPSDVIGEMFTTLGQNFDRWALLGINKGKTWDQFVDEQPAALVDTIATTVLLGGMHTGLGVIADASMRKQAEANGSKLTEIFQRANELLMRQSSPETFDSFFQTVAPDTSVFIAADKLRELIQTGKVDAAKMPSVTEQALTEATNVGPGVEIPVSELVSAFAGTGVENELVQHLRTAPSAETAAEAKEKGAEAMQYLDAEVRAILQEKMADAAFTQSAEEVQQDIEQRVGVASPFGPQYGSGIAKLLTAWYVTQAKNIGVTPTQLRDGWTDTKGNQQRGWRPAWAFGDQVLPGPGFDHGKAMLNVGLDVGAMARDQQVPVEAVKAAIEKTGAKVLSGEVVESEYEHEGKMVKEMTYVPHLDRPLTEAETNQVAAETGQEAIGQYYRGQGSLWGPKAANWGAFNPEFFKNQKGGALQAAAESFNQPDLTRFKPVDTSSPAFKTWFGDSKVVDAGGKPLRVYHGAAPYRSLADFTAFKITSKDLGVHFGTTGQAEDRLRTKAYKAGIDRLGFPVNEDAQTIPVYLSVQNPLRLEDTGNWNGKEQRKQLLALFPEKSEELGRVNTANQLRAFLTSLGYDGVVYQNKFEVEGQLELVRAKDRAFHEYFTAGEVKGSAEHKAYEEAGDALAEFRRANYGPDSYIVFRPEQIKSAISNTGEFSNKDPRILYQAVSAPATRVAATLQAKLTDQYAASVAEYTALDNTALGLTTSGGQVLNTDLARELSPEYRADRTALSAAVHEPASAFIKKLYAAKLAANTPEGRRPVVVFTAGGTGAGKSTGLGVLGPIISEAEIVYDTNMNSLESSVKKIEQALTAGRSVVVLYIYREPIDALVAGALPRAMRTGRAVPLAEHLRTHVGSREVAQQLQDRYTKDPRVVFMAVDNSLGRGNAAARPLAEIPQVVYHGLQEKLNDALDKEHQAGRISASVHAAFRNEAAAAVRQQGSGRVPTKAELPAAARGAVSEPVVGIHFSQQPRQILASSMWGTGLRGAEGESVRTAKDSRLRHRIAFYVNTGEGIHPESGVGGQAHAAALDNLYDADADVLKIWRNIRDERDRETAVLDAGFDGFMTRSFGRQGAVVMLGNRAIEVEQMGMAADPTTGAREAVQARAKVVPAPQYPDAKLQAMRLLNDTTLPAGRLTKAEWQGELERRGYDVDLSTLNNTDRYYKDAVAAIYWQGEQWYYSQLSRAVDNAPAKVFSTGKAVAQWLKSNAGKLGVKAAEIEATGLTDWLETQGKVSREDVAAFLAAGGVRLEETVLVTSVDMADVEAWWNDEGGANEDIPFGLLSTAEAEAAVRQYQDEVLDYAEEAPKFADYQLPGGENYREWLLKLPLDTRAYDAAKKAEQSARITYREAVKNDAPEVEQVSRKSELDAALATLAASTPKTFNSSHFPGHPGIVAHIRTNERVDADGKRVLFIEEIQSDWAQKGRKEGFASPLSAAAEQRFLALRAKGEQPGKRASDVLSKDEFQEFSQLARERNISNKPPSAPFVTDTKSWTALALKRMIAHAVEQGFDRVAWTTGEQQAARYDLSKQIDSLRVRKDGAQQYTVVAELKDGGLHEIGQVAEKALPEHVGKDLAAKISEQKDDYQEYRGLDLKVGGEGMKGYYDSIVPQVANDVLRKLGGGKVTESNQLLADTGAKQQGFDITPELAATVSQGVPLFQPGTTDQKRGSFTPSNLEIRFLAQADYSTALHELGHFFLHATLEMAAQPNAPQAMVDQANAILEKFGLESIDEWRALTLAQQTEFHEQFAESWEQYLFTGKAPSLALQPLFRRFTDWMKRVYLDMKAFVTRNPRAKMDPDFVQIMDRLVATEQEIAEAADAREYKKLFEDAAAAGMSPEQFAEYLGGTDEALGDAEAMLRSRSLRDLRWTSNKRAKLIAQAEAANAKLYADMKAAVAKEVADLPINKARRWLKKGEMLSPSGDLIKVLEGNKLNIDDVKALFPAGALEGTVDLSKLGYGQYGMLAKDGLAPDLVAEMFGFTSGEALVRELLATPKFADQVQQLTDDRMVEAHGDLNSPDAIAQAADEAIHNDARLRSVATELWALNKNVGSPASLVKAAKEYARQIVAQRTSRTLKPWQFAAAETRAAKAAREALRKGDREEAAKQVRLEILNAAAAKEAYRVEAEIKKITDRWKKLVGYKDDSSAVKTRDAGIVNATRAVLAEFGIGTKGENAREYVDLVKQYDPGMGEVLSEIIDGTTADAKDWRLLPVSQLRDLNEAIDALWYLAKRSRQVEIDGKLVSRAEIEQELFDRLDEIGIPDTVPGETSAVTKAEKNRMKFDTWLASLRRVESWVGSLDGAQEMGPFRKYVWSQIRDAGDQYRLDKTRYYKRYEELLKTIAPSLTRRLIEAPELGYTFGKAEGGMGKVELLHALLHTGNKSNLRKLLLGRNWATETATGELDTRKWDAFVQRMQDEGILTKTDYDFAQGVWDMLEEMKPAAQKAHKDVFGRYFDEVTADEFTNQFGTYRGGYVPATVDSSAVQDAALRELANTENENLSYAFPTTSKGFTKKRVEYNRPLLLDLRTLTGHIDKVLLFAHLTSPVNDVRRLIMSKRVSQPLGRIQPQAIGSVITPWLNRAAKQTLETKIPGRDGLGRFWSALRTRTGMAAMMANVANSVQQVTGASLAMLKVRPRHLAAALVQYTIAPREMTHFVAERSPYMQTRIDAEVAAASVHIDEILINPNVYQKGQAWARQHAYFMQSAVDSVVGPVIWLGAYNQALETMPQGLDATEQETYARRLADSAVRETQGSTVAEDVASFETGSAFYRMFTQFAGYFNMNANLLGTEFSKLSSDMGLRKGAGRGLYLLTFGLMVPALVGELIMQLFKGGPGDEDGDGELDDWIAALFGYGLARYVTAMVPVAGTAANSLANSMNSKPYDDRISTAPAVSMIESAVRAPQSVYKAIVDDGKPSRAIRDVATLISLSVGLPANLLAKPAGYAADVATGHVNPTSIPDAIRGTITGTASPESKQ